MYRRNLDQADRGPYEAGHPKLAELCCAPKDVLAYKIPQAHWRQITSTNPLERLNKEIKRRTNVVGIFHMQAAIRRLVGALMLQNDEWAVTSCRYMTLETVAAICEDTTKFPENRRPFFTLIGGAI